MTGRFPSQVDNCHLWTNPPASSRDDDYEQCLVSDSVVNNTPTPNIGGDLSRSTQPQFAFRPDFQSQRGFGLRTGIPSAPEILINNFNREAYTIMASEPSSRDFRPMAMQRSPSFTLTRDATEPDDFSFHGAFDEDATTSPALDGRQFSRTDLGIPSSQPLSRNGSQASSRFQDDAVSLTFSTASAGEDFNFPLGPHYFTPTPGTSFSQTSMGAVAQFPSTSPVDNCQWQNRHNDLPAPASTSPSMDFSTSCDIDRSFSTTSTDFSDIPRSTPRRQPQQSALSQSLQSMASSPAPNLPEPSLPPDPWSFDLPSDEQALSASFAWMDSQNNGTGLILDTGFANINITPPNPLDSMTVEEPFGTSPGDYHPLDYGAFAQSSPHSFPAPQRQPSEDLLAVPLARRRRPRAFSATGTRPPSGVPVARTNTSTNPIPIPRRPQQARNSLTRSLPGSVPHSRGRRKGPMEENARQSAKKTRNEKTICIRCKGSKQRCHRPEDQPDASCDHCEKIANSPKKPGPCTKAYFEDLVLAGSLNVKYHHDFTHLTTDRQQRIHKTLAPEFNLDDCLRVLDHARDRFNLRVYHGDKRVYGLNLDIFFRYLKKVNDQLKEESEGDFAGFLDKDLVDSKTDEWMSTLTEVKPSPREDILELYLAMSSMPEHATFYYTSKANQGPTVKERIIDPQNPAEEDFLKLAARLARIIYRKVEIQAMLQLQKDLHDILLQQGAHHHKNQLVPYLHRLGCVLVYLRTFATHPPTFIGAPQQMPSPTQCRATELCKVLYSYYQVFRRRLPEPLGSAWEDILKGTWTRAFPSEPLMNVSPSAPFSFPSTLFSLGLAEASHAGPGVWNMFPVMGGDTSAGFETWMAMAPSGSPAYL